MKRKMKRKHYDTLNNLVNDIRSDIIDDLIAAAKHNSVKKPKVRYCRAILHDGSNMCPVKPNEKVMVDWITGGRHIDSAGIIVWSAVKFYTVLPKKETESNE